MPSRSQTRHASKPRGRKNRTRRTMQEGKRWLIGTAGAMVSREKWLSIPGLNCLEVNSTFYSLLGEKTAANLAALPDRVSFVFKVSKHITHLKRLNGVGEAWRKFRGSVKDLEKRTTAYLFQLPPSFARNAENVARIEKLAKLVGKGGPQIVVEFRHASWLVPETYALFRKLQWCIAGVLVQRPPDNTRSKKWMGTMPTGVYLPPRTSPMMYFRVHGKPGYRGYVVGGLLKDIAQKMMRTGAKTNAMVFNNVFFDHRTERCTTVPAAGRYAAVCDAAMFAELVERKFVY